MENNKILTITIAFVLIASAVGIYWYYNDDDEQYDLVIACGTKNCYEPFWVAEHFGFFDDENVKVQMMYVDGGGSATTALLAGQVDMTLVGADPAIRLFDKTTDGMAIATIETSLNASPTDFAALSKYNVDLTNPATSLLNPDGKTVRIHCGIDITTGYYSGYISYLYSAYQAGELTKDQYELLKTVKTNTQDGGIVDISFNLQITALLQDAVQMLCSGSTVAMASQYQEVEALSSPYESAVGCCIIIVSGNAIAEKSDAITKALKALDKACAFIENDETKLQAAEYCVEFYGSSTWTIDSQMTFFNSQYWDICYMLGLDDFLNFKAGLLGYENFDCSDRITQDFLIAVHDGADYAYDSEQNKIVSNSLI